MIQHWKTCTNLVLERLQLRAEKALDSLRLAMCRATVHHFEPDTHNCTRCDAARVEHWGHWVVLDG